MKNSQKSFVVPLLIVIVLLVIGGGYLIWSKKSNNLSAPNATINQDSLTTTSAFPTITGTAISMSSVRVDINGYFPAKGSVLAFYDGTVPVINGNWSFTPSQSNVGWAGPQGLSSGTYTIVVGQTESSSLVTGTLTVADATSSNQTVGWKTYTNSQYGFSIQYPTGTKIDLSDTGSKKVGFQPITTKGNLSIDVYQSSANCFDTASGADPTYKTIGSINFTVWNASQEYSAGDTSVTARRYCTSHNGYEYNIITKLPYKSGTTPLDVDKDAVLNQILSTFKFTK